MAEDIINVYKLQIDEFKAQVQDIIDKYSKIDNESSKHIRNLNNVIEEQKALLRAEKQDLKELEVRKKQAFSKKEAAEFDKAINDAKLSIAKLTKGIGDASAELKRAKDAAKILSSEVGNTSKQTETFRSKVLQLGAAIGITFGVQQLVSFGKEAVDVAAKAEGIKRAFDKLNKPELLEQLRTATKGTVSDLDLMKQAVNANNFQIPLNTLATLFKFATQRASETGQSVDYLVESLVNGIARKSPLILDNLGINVQRIQKEFKKTGDFAQAATIIINQELEKQGDLALTNADKIARIGAVYENLKKGAGNILINIASSIGVAGDILAGAFKRIFNIQDEVIKTTPSRLEAFTKLSKEEQDKAIAQQERFVKDFTAINNKLQADLTKTNDFAEKRRINEQIKSNKIGIENAKNYLDDIAKLRAPKLKELTDEEKKLIEQQNKQIEELEKSKQKAILDEMQDGLKKRLATEEERNREELAKLNAIIPLTVKAEQLKNEAIEAEKRAHKQNLLDIEANFFKELEKEYEKNEKERKEQESKDEKEAQEVFEKNVKIAEHNLEESNKRRILSTKVGTIERVNAEISVLEDTNERILDDVKLTEDEKFNLIKENEERIKALRIQGREIELKNIQVVLDTFSKGLSLYTQYSQNQTQARLNDIQEQADAEIAANQLALDSKIINQKEFDARKREIDAKEKSDRSRILTEQAEQEKVFAIFNATIDGANAVLSALAGPLGPIGAVIAGTIAAAQIAIIASQPIPKFAKGTPFVERGNNKSGVDTIPAWLNEGERVITKEDNKKNWNVYEALRLGKFDNYVQHEFIAPVLAEAKREFEREKQELLAQGIAQSIIMNQKGLNDTNIVDGLKLTRRAVKDQTEALVSVLKQGKSPYK